MKNSLLYKVLKGATDRSIRLAAAVLPVLRADKATELLAAVAPFSPALPQNFAQLPPALAQHFQETISLPAVRLFAFRGINVSWHMVVFRALRVFLPALAHPREVKHYDDAYLLQQWTGKLVTAPADGRGLALVHNEWTGANYYHWMVDSLPRLLLLRAGHPDCRLLMPETIPAFVRDSAAMFGFTDLLLLKQQEVLSKASLLIPEHTTPPGFQNPALLRQVRETLMRAVYQREALPTPFRKVFVSRRSQRVRRLLNEADIAAVLARHGYELVEFEGLSLTGQVRLMAETHSFVSIHGAGMTNMLFLPPGTRVAELLNADKIVKLRNQHFENLVYYRLASALELPYYCLPCANEDDSLPTNDTHLRVDVEALNQLLDLMARA